MQSKATSNGILVNKEILKQFLKFMNLSKRKLNVIKYFRVNWNEIWKDCMWVTQCYLL